MPEGLADPLTRGELVDLVRFLSELGKVGPYSVSKARLVRRWQALEPTNEAYGLLSAHQPRLGGGQRPFPGLVAGLQHGGGRATARGVPLFKHANGSREAGDAGRVSCAVSARRDDGGPRRSCC